MKNRSRRIAVNAVFLALLIIFTLLMNIPIFLIATAVLPLIVLAASCQIEGWFTSIVMAISFGLLSFFSAFISPSPLAPIFQNPLISVLPRVFIGVFGLAVFKLCIFISSKIESRGVRINKRIATLISSGLGAALMVIFNTALVLVMIWVLYGGESVAGTAITIEFITGLISVNFAIEIIGAGLITPPIVLAVNKFLAATKKSPLTDDDIAEHERVSAERKLGDNHSEDNNSNLI